MSSNPLANKSRAWSALFSEPMSELVQRYTASVDFDHRLAAADIAGSLAHAEMLAAQKVIGEQDYADIARGMEQIRADIASGAFEWKLDKIWVSFIRQSKRPTIGEQNPIIGDVAADAQCIRSIIGL